MIIVFSSTWWPFVVLPNQTDSNQPLPHSSYLLIKVLCSLLPMYFVPCQSGALHLYCSFYKWRVKQPIKRSDQLFCFSRRSRCILLILCIEWIIFQLELCVNFIYFLLTVHRSGLRLIKGVT